MDCNVITFLLEMVGKASHSFTRLDESFKCVLMMMMRMMIIIIIINVLIASQERNKADYSQALKTTVQEKKIYK
jgi:hypothetical protein